MTPSSSEEALYPDFHWQKLESSGGLLIPQFEKCRLTEPHWERRSLSQPQFRDAPSAQPSPFDSLPEVDSVGQLSSTVLCRVGGQEAVAVSRIAVCALLTLKPQNAMASMLWPGPSNCGRSPVISRTARSCCAACGTCTATVKIWRDLVYYPLGPSLR